MRSFNVVALEKKTQLEHWLRDLNLKSLDFIHIALSFGIGFLCGLLIKRCCKYIVFLGVSLAVLLAFLQNYEIITINVATIQHITGLQDITNLSNLISALVEQAKKHTLELSCSSVGFFLGFKTG